MKGSLGPPLKLSYHLFEALPRSALYSSTVLPTALTHSDRQVLEMVHRHLTCSGTPGLMVVAREPDKLLASEFRNCRLRTRATC